MRHLDVAVVTALALVAFRGCEVAKTQAADEQRRFGEPEMRAGSSLWSVIAKRRSARTFGSRGLLEVEIGQLLWAAQGVLDGHRAAPSAGALYPLTVRVIDASGIWRYVPSEHALVRELAGDRRDDLAFAALRQPHVRAAAITLAISGDFAITANKYGRRSAERFVAIEAGHVAQNVLLAATALDLAAVPVGAFEDETLRKVLALPANETPLYLVSVGARP
jgi:SagB-type dehydrogenase family enzyme